MDLGLERAGMECAWQVEIDEFCRKVLTKHWPNVPKFNDVRECGKHNLKRVDLIAGGFPCQDVSIGWTGNGSGKGLDGERSGLWHEYARIIRELRPSIVIVENSPVLSDRGLDRVLAELAAVGMDAVWTTLRASQFGAKHRRLRMFIYADTDSNRLQRWIANAHGGSPVAVSALGPLADWSSVSTSFGCRSGDGIPDRVDRTKGLGNAVVPQIAEWIGRRILEAA